MASLPPIPDPTMLKEPTPPAPSQPIETPLLDTPIASEPADKWAENTLGAVSGEQDRIQDLPASNVSTPGLQVPGAFPHLPGASYQPIQSTGAAMSSALEAARGYVGAAGQKVAEFVPPSVSRILRKLSCLICGLYFLLILALSFPIQQVALPRAPRTPKERFGSCIWRVPCQIPRRA